MYQAKVFFAHWLSLDKLWFDIPVEIHNVHIVNEINLKTYNVLNISNEPEATRMKNHEIIKLKDRFNLILTWDEEILRNCPNAKFFACGMSWINANLVLPSKKFKVSTVVGTKNITMNHLMRHELWRRQNEIKIPKVFWNSSHNPMPNINKNPLLGPNPEDKVSMFNAMFHIAIENSNCNNYFSEKLLDCILTDTIPIYVGCPNIGDFFDINGIIQAGSVDDIINICNSLSEKTYEMKTNSMKENKTLAKPYVRDFTERLYEVISKELKSV